MRLQLLTAIIATTFFLPFEATASLQITTGDMWVVDNAEIEDDLVGESIGRILAITPEGGARVTVTATDIDNARIAANDTFPEGTGARFTDNDIVFDHYGNFYFTESVSDGLFRLNENTGLEQIVRESDIVAVTQLYDPEITSAYPEKIAAGSGDSLYVTEAKLDAILEIDRVTGEVSVLVSQEDFTTALSTSKVQVNGGIALSPDETTLYVVNDYDDDSLIKIDISGPTPVITELVSEEDFPTQVTDKERFITTAPNGDIILVDEETEDIFRVTPEGVVSIFLDEDDIEAILTSDDYDPTGGIDFDLDGNFFIAQSEPPSSIIKWTVDNKDLGTIDTNSGVVFADEDSIQSDLGLPDTTVEFLGGFTFVPVIQEDPRVIPEPTSIAIWALLGVAVSTIGWYRRKY